MENIVITFRGQSYPVEYTKIHDLQHDEFNIVMNFIEPNTDTQIGEFEFVYTKPNGIYLKEERTISINLLRQEIAKEVIAAIQ